MNFFQKLFGLNKSAPETEHQDPTLSTASAAIQTAPLSGAKAVTFDRGLHVGYKTDVGQYREQNEDALFSSNHILQSNDGDEPFGLFIVADGMGGYNKGEVASDVAARTSAQYMLNHIYLPGLQKASNANQTPIIEALTNAVMEANEQVVANIPEAGTTLTMAVIMGRTAYLAHVGDSRAYLFSGGELTQITQDHSLVARLVELGQATPEEALTHPQRNVLYRAIGQSGALEVDTYLQALPANSYLLLCSDGLWSMIEDSDITRILQNAVSPTDAANQLIDTANQNGGEDNITAVVVAIGP